MPYKSGECTGCAELFNILDSFLQTSGWERVYSLVDSNNTRYVCIWCSEGDGHDKIYIQGRLDTKDNSRIVLDGIAGFDKTLEFWEQPGSIQQWNKCDYKTYSKSKIPVLTLVNSEKFYYWIFVNEFRVVVVARLSTVYESCYLGFLKPFASERQYAYPMYVAGSGVLNGHKFNENVQGSFVYPSDGSGYLRKSDGNWEELSVRYPTVNPQEIGTLFPYNTNNKDLITNYKEYDAIAQDNFLLFPIFVQLTDTTGVQGLMYDIYWVSGARDLDAERIFTYNNESYIVFDTKDYRGANTYFCVKMK